MDARSVKKQIIHVFFEEFHKVPTGLKYTKKYCEYILVVVIAYSLKVVVDTDFIKLICDDFLIN